MTKLKSKPEVSVVIPAYNEATYIDRLLEALHRQIDVDFEVIVADADSGDGTDKVIESFADKMDVKLLVTPPKGPADARNKGAHKAKGEWILFLDADDDLPDVNFVRTLVDVSKQKGWQTSSAKVRHADANIFENIGSRLNYHYVKLLAHTKHPVAAGWCILTKRAVFEEYNGFNEKIQFGEDYDYVSRVGHLGFGFVDETYYFVDLRRPRAEGVKFVLKGIGNEIYRHTHRYNLEKNPIEYKFGQHQKRK
ncbi:MAG: glycosyltransferase family 2 protein [Cumulibacter sp.]